MLVPIALLLLWFGFLAAVFIFRLGFNIIERIAEGPGISPVTFFAGFAIVSTIALLFLLSGNSESEQKKQRYLSLVTNRDFKIRKLYNERIDRRMMDFAQSNPKCRYNSSRDYSCPTEETNWVKASVLRQATLLVD